MTKFSVGDTVRINDPKDDRHEREFTIAKAGAGRYTDTTGEDWPAEWTDRVGTRVKMAKPAMSPAEALQELHVKEQANEHTVDALAYAMQTPRRPPDIKAEIADEAKRIVTGARRSAYGTPEQNFERIARFWQAYFENTGRGDAKITAADVSPMMRLMKEARLCETPDHRDSFVDLVGYTLTGAEVNGVKGVDGSSGV